MLFSTDSTNMSSVSRHILKYVDTHRKLLTVGKTLVPLRIRIEFLIIDAWDFVRIDRKQLVLLVPMTNEPGAPAAVDIFKEETESAVCLSINLASVNCEALRDCRLHLGDGTGSVGGDVRGYSVAAVHDKGTFVHAGLGAGNEIFIMNSPGPGRVYMGVLVED